MKTLTCALALLSLLALRQPATAGEGAPAQLKNDGFKDTPMIPGTPWHIHDRDRPQPPVVTPGKSPTLGVPAPADAEVLFDGKDLSKWQTDRGQDAAWPVTDGFFTVARGDIRTRGAWADFQLHVEFSEPTPARGEGQGRGNSGIMINHLYEVQVLDNYQAPTYADGACGGIYGQSITKQEWSQQVAQDLRTRFPYADLTIENRASRSPLDRQWLHISRYCQPAYRIGMRPQTGQGNRHRHRSHHPGR